MGLVSRNENLPAGLPSMAAETRYRAAAPRATTPSALTSVLPARGRRGEDRRLSLLRVQVGRSRDERASSALLIALRCLVAQAGSRRAFHRPRGSDESVEVPEGGNIDGCVPPMRAALCSRAWWSRVRAGM